MSVRTKLFYRTPMTSSCGGQLSEVGWKFEECEAMFVERVGGETKDLDVVNMDFDKEYGTTFSGSLGNGEITKAMVRYND